MRGRLFTLVDAEDYEGIVAWGIEITAEDECEAVTYRRDPVTRHTTHGVHDSADAARQRYSRLLRSPLAVLYMDYADELARLYALLDVEPARTP